MNTDYRATDETLLKELGGRLARVRLARNMTQGQLAREAGVGLRTLQRLETGAVATQLSVFLRVCRVLGVLTTIQQLVPEPLPSPMDQLRRQSKVRRRASRRSVVKEASTPWTWGEPAT